MSLRAATVRGLVRSPSAGVFSGADDQWNPRMLPDLAAWFDALDTRTMLSGDGSTITDGGAVALWGDKSGNSGVNCLCAPGANTTANSATLGAIGALGTGDFTVVARVSISSFSSGTDLLLVGIGNGANSANLIAKNGTSRIQMSKAAVGYVSATNGSNLSVFTTYTITYTKSGTTGTYYINGIADGTCTDSFDYTANSGVSIGQFNTGVGGIVYHARVYSVALDAAGVLADYNGTVQANNVVNCDFSQSGKKLANGDTFVCATGQTVTLNSSGATGARIAGERDLFQGTAANRPVLLKYSGTKYGYFSGVGGSYCSSLDIAFPADTLWIEGYINPNTYTLGASAYTIFAKRETGLVSCQLTITGTKSLQLGFSTDGTTLINAAPSSSFTATDGTPVYVAASRNGTTGDVKYYTSSDGVTWSQLGATVAAATGNIADTTSGLEVGSNRAGGANLFIGQIYRVKIRNGLAGDSALVADFNPALYTSGTTFTASTGEVWTVNGGAHIVTRTGLYGDGVNDFVKMAAANMPQPQTVYWIGEPTSWTANDTLFDGTNATLVRQTTATPEITINAGSFAAANTGLAVKTCAVLRAVFNGASSALGVNRLAATTGDAGTNAPNGFTLWSNRDGSGPSNAFVSEVAIYSAAHDKPTRDRMALYAGRRHGFAA